MTFTWPALKLNLNVLSVHTKKKLNLFLVALVLSLSAFTHLYNLSNTYEYEGDEIRDVKIVESMLINKTPLLLGPPASVGSMSLGPAYYYLMAPSLLLSAFDPVGPAVMVAIFGIGTTGLLIYIGSRLYGLESGLFAGLFYAISPVMLYLSRNSWNPNVVPFFVALLLTLYPLKSPKISLFFGFVSGIIFQLHYLSFIVPILLIGHNYYTQPPGKKLSHLLSSWLPIILGFFLAGFPFWLYEFSHSFVNSIAIITYFTHGLLSLGIGEAPYLLRLVEVVKSLVMEVMIGESALSNPVSSIMWISGLSVFIVYFWKSRGIYPYLIVGGILFVALFNSDFPAHYLAFLFPLVCLMVGRSLTYEKLYKLPAIILILSLLIPFTVSFRDRIYLIHSNSDLSLYRQRFTLVSTLDPISSKP
jgi:4-amino-4-deoxy-L-arabinose transferase-like glycosyltransferase